MKKLFIMPIVLGATVFLSTQTSAVEQKPCTREYMPVCGEVQVQCITTPCNPIQQTFSNKCVASNAGAKILYTGECKEDIVVGGDKDEHGCIGSAGYTRDETLQSCVRSWEVNQELITWAYDKGITTISSIDEFGFDNIISREQAAKMLVVAIEKSGLPVWTLKLPAGSCEWTDKQDIYPNLVDYVHKSCTMGLFKGDNNQFVPYYQFTKQHLDIVLDRVGEYADKVRSFLMSDYAHISTNTDLTRGDMLKVLKKLYDFVYNSNNELAKAQTALDAAKAKRSAQNLTSYEMTQQRSCFCIEDATRTMRYNISNGSIVGDVFYHDDDSKVSDDFSEGVMSIQEAFDMIQEAIDADVDKLTVTYDNKLGYPKIVSIDRSFMIADEEMYYVFKILGQDEDNQIVGNWTLSTYNNQDKSNLGVTINFEDDKVYAKICNNISATYTSDEDNITLHDMISTLMYCEAIMDIEDTFGATSSWKYTIDEDNLTLSDGTNTLKWIRK